MNKDDIARQVVRETLAKENLKYYEEDDSFIDAVERIRLLIETTIAMRCEKAGYDIIEAEKYASKIRKDWRRVLRGY
tara:strand:- start:180 stop:410 length:231 start_codon:yes stop_codon:yes gene_type:complete